jgi:hypothetical protein
MAVVSNNGQRTYKNDLEGLFDTFQEQRADLLSVVRDAQLAVRLLAVDEARRLADEVDPNDSRIARYTASSAVILQRAAALDVETQIANIRVPPVTKTETLLQGRITDEAANASAHVTVTLVDEKGAPVAGVAPVETDDSGYYAFILQPAQVDAIGTHNLTLQVGNESGKVVPAAAKPFTLASGKVTVAETQLQPSELTTLRLRASIKEVTKAVSVARGLADSAGRAVKSPAAAKTKAKASKPKAPKAKAAKKKRAAKPKPESEEKE